MVMKTTNCTNSTNFQSYALMATARFGRKLMLICLICAFLFGIEVQAQRIAIISDPHIQDVVGHPELVRTWESQARSTRLFNENYFAFLAALDDAAQRGIKLVILSGDLTDNGQELTCQAVTRILRGFEQQYGMRFFMTTGNHDPNYPVMSHWGQKDFLGADGQPRVIYSDSCQFFLPNKPQEILTPDTVVPSLRCLGYPELIQEWHDFGFLPHEGDVYWEHPDNPTTYPDASYLVEPESGLWLLSIDGSVHTHKEAASVGNQTPLLGRGGGRPPLYNGSWPGYNNVMAYKPFLVDWVRSVVRRSQEQGKRLVVFSHYPLLDFNNGATDIVREAWGEKAFDLTRVPKPEVAEAFYEAGVRLHIAGHMHINQTGIYRNEGSRRGSLVNVQVPTVAGYMPAYKILTIENDSIYDFQTVRIDSVPGYDALFPRYGNLSPLSSRLSPLNNYRQFCSQWFSELVANRFVKQDLPQKLQDYLPQMGGTYADASSPSGEATWTGLDLIADLYRLRFAGSLALSEIPQARLQAYEDYFSRCEGDEVHPRSGEQGVKSDISVLAEVFHCMLNGLPDNHFRVNVRTGELLH